jgi:hypothetical protein
MTDEKKAHPGPEASMTYAEIMAKRAKRKHPKEKPLGPSEKVAIWLTKVVGTMGFFWACAVLVTVPLFWKDAMPVVQYVSSGYLQLILLPLIMVGQALLSRAGEMQANQMFVDSEQADREIEVVLLHLEWQNERLVEQGERIEKQEKMILQILNKLKASKKGEEKQ